MKTLLITLTLLYFTGQAQVKTVYVDTLSKGLKDTSEVYSSSGFLSKVLVKVVASRADTLRIQLKSTWNTTTRFTRGFFDLPVENAFRSGTDSLIFVDRLANDTSNYAIDSTSYYYGFATVQISPLGGFDENSFRLLRHENGSTILPSKVYYTIILQR
jgi:hypothetical protein